jgi:uroporphyrinogen decarboxylase
LQGQTNNAGWSTEEATEKVKEIIHKAAPGGGFILSDNHGEIPYQVPENVLFAISDAVHKYGNYPINID